MDKKQGLNRLRPRLISVAVASCFVTSAVFANPTAPTVVSGTAAIQGLGTNLVQITNSPSAIINWQSFSIGANEITRFIQQSQSSAVLNRVTGAAGVIDPSVILGALQSNGRVLLINPSGIVFGAGAQIDVAGLVASSLNLSDADFLANRLKFTDPGAGSVVNQGNITTGSGGHVYLVGPAVTNSGIITSPQGEVVLAAGNSVELVNPGTPNLRVEITAPDNQAVNLGQVVADAGRIGIYAGLINNSGTVRASSAVTEGGKILLKATKQVTLESSSILDASGNGGGTIEVLSKNGGTVNVAGRLDASAPNGGDGGFIETSASVVNVAGGTQVTTAASQGKTGTWLIDPTNFSIDAGYGGQTLSSIGADTLSSNLGSTSVTLATDSYGGELGDINVNAAVLWNSGNSLTLIAHNDVNVNTPITNAGTGGINLYAGWNGASSTNPAVISCCSGTINLLAPITTFGTAVLSAGYGITQNASSAITAASLLAKSGFGGVTLDAAANNVGTLAGSTEGPFLFKNGSSLIVGSVASGNTAIGTINGIASTDANEVAITVTTGNLTVNQDILAAGGNSNNASITLVAQGALTVNGSTLSAQGNPGEGDGNSTVALTAGAGGITLSNSTVEAISDSGCCGTSRNATVSMDAAGGITLTNSDIVATGGPGGSPAGSATATLSAGGNIQLTGSSIQVSGAAAGSGSSAFAAGGSAYVSVSSSAGSISMDGGSSINVAAGNAGSANLFSSSGTAFADGSYAQASLFGANGITMSGAITATGGNGGDASAAYGGTAIAWGGSADVYLNGGSGVATVNGTVSATGGDGGSASSSTGSAYAFGGSANVHLRGDGGVSTGSGAISAAGGTGGSASGGFPTTDGGQAIVDIGSFGSPPITIGAGGISATGGAGGSGGPGFGGFAGIFVEGGEGAPVGAVQIGGTLAATGGNGGGAQGGDALIVVAGSSVNVAAAISATGGSGAPLGVAEVDISSLGNVTLGGNITTSGGVFVDQQSIPPDTFGGIYVEAGLGGAGAIIANGGILSAVRAAGTGEFPMIELRAVNGIGTINAPIRILDASEATGPDINAFNLGATGDIAVSAVASDITIGGDLLGLHNSNPNGIYLIQTEAAGKNLQLDIQFLPEGSPLMSGQSVLLGALQADVIIGPSGNIATSGTGFTSLLGNNITSTGSITGLVYANALGGTITLNQTAGVTLGLLQATGHVSVNSSGGAIVNGNAGLNILAPSAGLFGALGVGSLATPIVTQTGVLSGSATGTFGVVNSGDLAINGFTFSGTDATIGTTGTLSLMTPISASSGNLVLAANNGMLIEQNVFAGGDLTLTSGAGDLGIAGADVMANNITLAGNNIFIGFNSSTAPTNVVASGLVTGVSAGNFNVLGGSTSTANALLEGQDVALTVGTTSGFLNIASGSDGATAKISSVSPTTITVNFPNLDSGGYFVDGVEGAVTNGSTGFFADGSPAVLSQNLIVSYGLLPPPPTGGGETGEAPPNVDDAINQVIASTNQQIEEDQTPVPTTAGDPNAGEGEKDKKELPVCR